MVVASSTRWAGTSERLGYIGWFTFLTGSLSGLVYFAGCFNLEPVRPFQVSLARLKGACYYSQFVGSVEPST